MALFQWGIKPLVDNHHSDRYFFILKVYTGYRLGSGTESQIAFRLSGDRHDTGVRILSDGIRKVNFQTVDPPHEKTTKMTVRPVKTQIILGICPV